jgi:uncharacterized protein YhjY with autotransporter beta-barrel domain
MGFRSFSVRAWLQRCGTAGSALLLAAMLLLSATASAQTSGTLVFVSPPSRITVGEPTTFTLRLTDSFGNPVAGAVINWSGSMLSPPSGQTEQTGADGIATFTATAAFEGGFTLVAARDGDPSVNTSQNVVAVSYSWDFVAGPPSPGPYFSEDFAPSIDVRLEVHSGSVPDPDPDVPVTFTISSGNATFFNNGSTTIGDTSTLSGTATSGSVKIGRTADDVVIDITAENRSPLQVVYNVQSSTYTLTRTTPTPIEIDDTSTATLEVRVERSDGITTPIALEDAVVTWSVLPATGSVQSPSPPTSFDGLASTSFTPAANQTASYIVTAQFDPGTGVAPATESFTVNVTAPARTLQKLSPLDPVEVMSGDSLNLLVEARDDGTATTSEPDITWSIDPASSDATIPAVTTAGTDGQANATLVAGTQTGSLQVRVARADNPASEVVFDVEVFAHQLSHPSPADATPSGVVGTAIPLKALLQRVGASSTPMGGENVHFVIASGPTGASFVEGDTRPTGADGIASVGLLATQADLYEIRAEYPFGAPTTSITFSVTVDPADYQLTLVEPADGARQEVGVVAPVAVRLTQNGNPLTGETIHWSTTLGTLDQPSIQTVADGSSTNQFRPDTTGTATLTARYDSPGGPVTLDFTIVGFENQLIAHAQPPAPLYTEETVGGVTARAIADDGTTVAGEDGVPVVFEIIAGNASFVGGSQTASGTSDASGLATSPGIALRRSLDDVVVRATSAGRNAVEFTLQLTASTYSVSLPAGTATPLMGTPGAPVDLAVVVERSGSGAPVALAGVAVDWSSSGGVLASSTSTTDGVGTAINSLSASAVGTHVVNASFDPLLTGVAPATAAIGVEISEVARSLTLVSGNGQSGSPGSLLPLPLVVEAADDGAAPSPPTVIHWSVSPAGAATLSNTATTTKPDNGQASVEVTIGPGAAPGTITVRALRDDSPAQVSFTINVQAPLVRSLTKPTGDAGDGQSGPLGSVLPSPLRALALDSGTPAAGITVNWTVSGDAFLSEEQTVTDDAGLTEVNVTLGTTPQAITITASRQDAPASTTSYVVTALATGEPVLRRVSGSGQRGMIQTAGSQPLVVELRQPDGSPVEGSTILWQALSGPVSPDQDISQTDASGRASIGFRYGDTPGTAVLRASSGQAHVDFELEALQAELSGAIRGNGQIGPVSQLLAEDFGVTVAAATKSSAGVTVFWEVTRGGGSLRDGPTTRTAANGEASNRLQLGPEPGLNEVVATIPGGGRVVFQAEGIIVAGQLRIVSGDNQTVPTNDPSDPLVIEVLDAGGTPLSGVHVRWSAVAPPIGNPDRAHVSVEHETTVTDAQGRSSNTARVLLPGPARVRVETSGVTTDPVEFRINGGIANIPGLNEEQRRTGQAIDNACPALAAIANRTPEQEDLYQRCLELADRAGDNPDEVRRALDQIPTRLGDMLVDGGFGTLKAQLGNHSARFEALRKMRTDGNNQFNVALWTPTGTLPLSFLPSALGQSGDDRAGEIGADFSRWGFFATGTIGRGKSRADNDARNPGFDFDTSGLTAGVDYRFSDRIVAGLSAGYAKHDNALRGGLGRVDTRGWTVSGYATWFNERNWYLDGVLSYGVNDYKMARAVNYSITALDGGRTVVDQLARADTDGNLLGTAISFGRDFQKGPWSLSTYLRGSYARVELDAYQERMIAGRPGAGLALQFDSRSIESLTSAFGGKATYVMSRDWGVLMPHVQLEWEHEFRDDPSRMVARFVHDPTGTPIERAGGAPIDTDYYNVGLGISALFPGGRSVYVYYEQLLGKSRLSQGTLSIGGRFEF